MHKIDSLRLQPVFSRFLTVWMVVLHLLGLLVLWQLQLHALLKISLSLLLLTYFIWQVRYHLLRSTTNAIKEVQLESDGSWRLTFNDGAELAAELLPNSFVKPWLIVLNFSSGSSFFPTSIVLPPDSLEPDLARRLRIHLLQKHAARHDASA